jgi:hypothetical protein
MLATRCFSLTMTLPIHGKLFFSEKAKEHQTSAN